jgi:nucleotidyltransferase substrate binding protein (TIGR01987 family)
MPMESIDLTTLENVIKTLDEIIDRYDKEFYDNAIRDALIQRFEYTYSLLLKFILRFLKLGMPEIQESLTFNEIIRNANEFGFLRSDLEKWTVYRQKVVLESFLILI